MSVSLQKNIGAYISAAYAGDVDSIVAGGAGNNVEVNGPAVDRFAYNDPLSVAVVYAIKATLAAGKTLSLGYSLQHSSDGETFTDFAPAASAVVASTSGANDLIIKQSVDLSGAERYVRVAYTPVLSATATDTAVISPLFVFGGEEMLSAV
jgi:hypothetical protein